MECKQVYAGGIRAYVIDKYNWTDYSVLSLYIASYVLRFLVDHWIKQADAHYQGTARARLALASFNNTAFQLFCDDIFTDRTNPFHSYFMKACEWAWQGAWLKWALQGAWLKAGRGWGLREVVVGGLVLFSSYYCIV